MKIIPPNYDPGENYEKSYGRAEYKDRKILEIGADIGSTATWFLSKGAKSVASVEGHKPSYEKLVENTKDIPEITPVFKLIMSTKDIEELITKFKPDFLHMDCEYCERFLNGIPDNCFNGIQTVQIEIHCDYTLNAAIFSGLLKMGYSVFEWTIISDTVVRVLPKEEGEKPELLRGPAWILLANRM